MAQLSKKYTAQGIENEAFDEPYHMPRRGIYGWDGSSYVAVNVDSNGQVSNVQQDTTGFTAIVLNHTAAGSAEVVAASAGKQITVYNIDMTVAASGTVGWKGGTATIVGTQTFIDKAGKEQNYFPGHMCKTAAGSGLYINTASAISVGGVIGITKL